MEEREAEESEYYSGKDSRDDQQPKKKRSHYGLFLQVERSGHTHRFHPLPLATPTSHTHTFHPLSTIVIHTFNLCKVQSMDDNCGEWVECMGVASGCGLKEIYRFPHTSYPYTPLVSVLFCSSIMYNDVGFHV